MRFATSRRGRTLRRSGAIFSLVIVAAGLPAQATEGVSPGAAPGAQTGGIGKSTPHLSDRKGFVEGKSVEDRSKRTARSKTFQNPDGSYTAQISGEVEHYWTGSSWADISNRLVVDPAGGYRNEANSFTVRFWPSEVRVETPQGVITLRSAGGRLGAPVVDPTGETVTYPDVWPGVDVRYRVLSTGMKEELVLRRRPSTAQFPFQVQGTSLSVQSDGSLAMSGTFAGQWKVPAPEVFAKDGQLVARAAPRYAVAADTVSLAVDPAWLASLDDGRDFPIVLDPSFWSVGSQTGRSYERNPFDDGYTTCDSIPTPCQPRVGIQNLSGWRPWRSVQYFPYESLFGKQIVSGQLILQVLQEGTTSPLTMKLYGDDVNGAFGGIWNWSNLGAFIGSGTASGDSFIYDGASGGPLAVYYQDLVNRRLPGMALKFVGDETPGVYTFKRFAWFQLQLTFNDAPTATTLVGPQTAWRGTSAPALAAYYIDPTGDSGYIDFEISGIMVRAVAAQSNNVVSYLPSLGPGTYSWRARSRDGYGAASPWSEWRTITVTSDTGVRQSDAWNASDGSPWNPAIWSSDPPYPSPSPTTCLTDGVPRVDICGNQGRMYASNGQTREVATGMQPVTDTEAVFTYQFSDRLYRSRLRVDLRGDGTFSPVSGYRLEVQSDSATVLLRRLSNSSSAVVGSFTYTKDTKRQAVRFSAEGANVRIKIWEAGTPEPDGEGQLLYTDPSPLGAGRLEFQHDWTSGARSILIDDLAVYDLVASNPLNMTRWTPAAAFSNGKKIFLSPANHGGQNVGCDGYLEDAWAHDVGGDQRDPSRSYPRVMDLLASWGYDVMVGNGTADFKAKQSNQFGADAHVPLHTNAGGVKQCGPPPGGGYSPTANVYGTRVMWQKASQEAVASSFLSTIQELGDSPGGEAEPGKPENDKACTPSVCSKYSTLVELGGVNAPVAAYIEYAFHIFQPDKDYLDQQRPTVAKAIAHAIGRWFGDTTGVGCGYPTCPQP